MLILENGHYDRTQHQKIQYQNKFDQPRCLGFNQNILSSVQLDIPTLTGVYYRILHIIFFGKR